MTPLLTFKIQDRKDEDMLTCFTLTLIIAREISPYITGQRVTSSRGSRPPSCASFCVTMIRLTSFDLLSAIAWDELPLRPSLIVSSSKLNQTPGYLSSSPGYVGPKVRLICILTNGSSPEQMTESLYRSAIEGCGSLGFLKQIVWSR